MSMVKQITGSTNEIYQLVFLKEFVFLRKEQLLAQFVENTFQSVLLALKKAIMISLSKTAVSINKFITKNISK